MEWKIITILNDFRIKVEDYGDFWKSCEKLARYFLIFLALKAYGISHVFLFCNIFTQTGYYKIIRMEYVIWLQISSAEIVTNVIKIGQHLTV